MSAQTPKLAPLGEQWQTAVALVSLIAAQLNELQAGTGPALAVVKVVEAIVNFHPNTPLVLKTIVSELADAVAMHDSLHDFYRTVRLGARVPPLTVCRRCSI